MFKKKTKIKYIVGSHKDNIVSDSVMEGQIEHIALWDIVSHCAHLPKCSRLNSIPCIMKFCILFTVSTHKNSSIMKHTMKSKHSIVCNSEHSHGAR